MTTIELIMILLIISAGIIASITDIRCGQVFNKTLIPFYVSGIFIDIAYYGWNDGNLLGIFFQNLLVMSGVLFVLYGMHSFAGGDVKLGLALSLLYPASAVVEFNGNSITLFWVIGISIIYGYVFLLCSSLFRIFTGRTKIHREAVASKCGKFFISYFIVMIYMMLINMCLKIADQYINIPIWLIWIICFIFAWFARNIELLRKRSLIIGTVILDIILGILMHRIPFSVYPETYLMIALIIMAKLLIGPNVYDEINTEDLKKGAILSTAASVRMQHSSIKGLPGVSKEDLRDRLTEQEAASVREWGKTKNGQGTIMIVRKIPFAVFIFLGFITYFILWRIQTL